MCSDDSNKVPQLTSKADCLKRLTRIGKYWKQQVKEPEHLVYLLNSQIHQFNSYNSPFAMRQIVDDEDITIASSLYAAPSLSVFTCLIEKCESGMYLGNSCEKDEVINTEYCKTFSNGKWNSPDAPLYTHRY